jgi:hypothetical protein
MANNSNPPKKRPSMATAYKLTDEEIAERELEADVAEFAAKANATIQEARSKMTDEERVEADTKAQAIFDRASAAAKSSRRRA